MKPLTWLGAPGGRGLALPCAQPTPSQFYAPRGVFFNDDVFAVADSGNHRILIWHAAPERHGQAADVVLCQPDFYTEGPNARGRGPENGLHLPTALMVCEGRLFVADAWHHRVLVWNEVPKRSDTPPDYAIGQADLKSVEPNRGGGIDAASLYWPYGIGFVGGWFYVADTGNRRVLGWKGLPWNDRPADLVVGQGSFQGGEENRGGPASACSFRWPHAVAGTDDVLYVADAGNHRVLGWSPAPLGDGAAGVVLGQVDFQSAGEFPYVKQGASRLRFPYSVARDGAVLAVADTANNRVLLWQGLPLAGAFRPADAVLGQPDFDATGENGWKEVTHHTLCWPYGVWMHRGRIAVADSGNNRVMMWSLEDVFAGVEQTCASQSPDKSDRSLKPTELAWAG
jgi:hypothetical protein